MAQGQLDYNSEIEESLSSIDLGDHRFSQDNITALRNIYGIRDIAYDDNPNRDEDPPPFFCPKDSEHHLTDYLFSKTLHEDWGITCHSLSLEEVDPSNQIPQSIIEHIRSESFKTCIDYLTRNGSGNFERIKSNARKFHSILAIKIEIDQETRQGQNAKISLIAFVDERNKDITRLAFKISNSRGDNYALIDARQGIIKRKINETATSPAVLLQNLFATTHYLSNIGTGLTKP